MRSIAVILAVLILVGPLISIIDHSEGAPSEIVEKETTLQHDKMASPPARKSSTSGNLTDHDPIVINNETELEDLMENESWPGNGTDEDPYRIEDLDIDAEGKMFSIFIGNTSSNVQIINCNIHNTSSAISFDVGIYLWNVSNIKVLSCNIHNSTYGVVIRFGSTLFFNNTVISHSDYGIAIYYSRPVDDLSINNCTFYLMTGDAIDIDNGSNISISNSTFFSLGRANDLSFCNDISISNNTYDGCCDSIRNNNCEDIQIKNLKLFNDLSHAIYIYQSKIINISNIYFKNNRGVDVNLQDISYAIIFNITDGPRSNTGCSFFFSNIQIVIFDGLNVIGQFLFHIENSRKVILRNWEIKTLSDYTPGDTIKVSNSFEMIMKNITLDSHSDRSLYLWRSSKILVMHCIISNSHGSVVELILSTDNKFVGNSFLQPDYDPIYNDYHTVFIGYDSLFNIFHDNLLSGSGFSIFHDETRYQPLIVNQEIANNNTLNGKPVHYFSGMDLNHRPVPDGNQYFFVNCTNLTIKKWEFRNRSDLLIFQSMNVMIEECRFIKSGYNMPSLDILSCINVTMMNCEVDFLVVPSWIRFCENVLLYENVIRRYIEIDHSNNITLMNNQYYTDTRMDYVNDISITGNYFQYGIDLHESARIFINRNDFNNKSSYDAISLSFSHDIMLNEQNLTSEKDGLDSYHCSNITIRNSNISECSLGLGFRYSEKIRLVENWIVDCERGMYFDHSSEGTISNNIILRSESYAIENEAMCEDLLFHSNAFLRNNKAYGNEYNSRTIQIMEHSWDNMYNLSGRGNYYSEHTSPDVNFDGIVDKEYELRGVGDSDEYPLARTPMPTFDAPDILRITPGYSSAILLWAEPEKRYGGSLDGYRIYMKEGSDPYRPVFNTSLSSLEVSGSLINGQSYSFMVSAYNEMGEGLLSAPVSTVPDGTGPEILIHTPVEGSSLNHEIVELQWSCIDVETSVEIIEISIDGGAFFEIAEGIGSYDMMDLPEGDHIVKIRSGNSIGLISEATVNFTVDRTSPYLVFDDPGPLYSNIGSFPILWTAGDNISGLVEEFTILIEGQDPVITEYYEYDVEIREEGRFNLIISFSDRAGNIGDASITVVRDETPPEITVTPESGSLLNYDTILLNWVTDGTGSPVVKTEVSVDRGRSENMMEGPLELKDLRDGSHIISFYIVDKARNFASVDVTFTIDTTSPRIDYQVPFGDEVPLDMDLEVVFSEDVVNVSIIINGESYDTRISGNKLTITPVPDWEMEGTYTVEIFAEDLAGNGLENGTYQFSTVGQGTASGKLVDPDGRPVKDAIITFQGTEYRSNSEGRFYITGPTGEYEITINAKGYIDQNLTITLVPGEEDELGNIVIIKEEDDGGGLSIIAIISILLSVSLLSVIIVLVVVIIRRSKRGLEYEDMAMMKEIMSGFGVRRNPREINCYQILGIRRRASDWEIKKAYRNMASIYHPDRNNGRMDPDYDEKIREINAAKTILLDREKREVHDRMLNHFE